MKNILNLFLILTATSSFSQVIKPIETRKTNIEIAGITYYYKDINGAYNKFLGSWKYQNSPVNPTKILLITFYKKEKVTGSGWFNDQIFARLRYVENGIEIYNTFPANVPAYMTRDRNIRGGYFVDPSNLNIIDLLYEEPGLGGKYGNMVLEYLPNPNGVAQLKWKVRSFRDPAKPFRIPNDMVLEKVN